MVWISALKRLWGMGGEEDKAGSKYVNRNHDYWSVRKWKDNTEESGCWKIGICHNIMRYTTRPRLRKQQLPKKQPASGQHRYAAARWRVCMFYNALLQINTGTQCPAWRRWMLAARPGGWRGPAQRGWLHHSHLVAQTSHWDVCCLRKRKLVRDNACIIPRVGFAVYLIMPYTAKLYFIHYSTPCKAMNEFGKWGCNSTNLNRKFFFVDFIYSPW